LAKPATQQFGRKEVSFSGGTSTPETRKENPHPDSFYRETVFGTVLKNH
jgi:hypothetical protein